MPLLHDLDERWIVQFEAYDTTAASFFHLARVLEDIKKCIAGVSPSHGVMKKRRVRSLKEYHIVVNDNSRIAYTSILNV